MSRSKCRNVALGFISERFKFQSTVKWGFPLSSSFHRKMVTLAYEEIVIPSKEGENNGGGLNDSNSCMAIILHGLMGSGRNWRHFSQQLGASLLEKSSQSSPGREWIIGLCNCLFEFY